jgi:ABC-2 type transport system permease protein
MKGVLATTERELRSYFLTPLGWVVATGFLFFNGLSFQTILDYLNDPRAPASMTPLDFFFGGTLFFWLAMLFVGPVLTMRLLSEERRSGTLEMLLTSPVTEGQVVLGKYLGAFLFYVFLWLPTLLYVALIARQLPLDWGPVAASYIGILAIGVFTSALTRNQVIAAVFAFALTFLCFLPAFLEFLVNDPKMRDVLGFLNLYQHMDEFSKGIVDTRHLVYYLSATALFLFLASRAVEAGKGR